MMQAFKKWLHEQLDYLDELSAGWKYIDDPGDTVEWVVEQVADRAMRLGLPDLVKKAKGNNNLHGARVYIAECLRAVEEHKPKPDLLTVKQAAERLNVSQRTIYDIIENGQLRCQRIGKGRGTIRIKLTDLDVCLNEPTPKTYKHLAI